MSLRFALAGNQNCGKTTLFNALTGSRAHVGNWPGVTIDRKEGTYKKLEEPITIVDLPGIYSLSPYTPEEVVSRNFLLGRVYGMTGDHPVEDDRPDCIINIVDATNIERNLYLTTQLMEIDCPIVIALNMMDVLRKSGDEIDAKGIENALGIPVVEIAAIKNEGTKELMEVAYKAAKRHREAFSVVERSKLKPYYRFAENLLSEQDVPNQKFHIVKLIEGDKLESEHHPKAYDKIREELQSYDDLALFDGDFEGVVADIRYKYIEKYISPYIKRKLGRDELSKSDKIDRILTNKWLGIPIFLAMMFLVFHLTFSEQFFGFSIPSPGAFLKGLVEDLVELIKGSLNGALASSPAWVGGLLVDGIITGVGAVLSFIPQILLLFLFLSILDNSGYMARVAFILDRAFRRFGLSGRAFMPLLTCFGCAVPGIMATKTLEDEREKRLSILLAPFFSCGAKLPIWATICSFAFGQWADFGVFGMYLLGIVVAILAAIFLSKTFLKGGRPPFLLELPPYHLPQLKSTLIYLWEKFKHYLSRAATIVAGSTVVLWFLSNFSWSWSMVEPYSEASIMGSIGAFLRPIFYPLGFVGQEWGWIFVVSILTGLIAKEMVVSTLSVLSMGFGGLAATVGMLSPCAAIAFMTFNLLCVPCMAAVSSARAELGKGRRFRFALLFWIVTAYVVALPFGLISFAGI